MAQKKSYLESLMLDEDREKLAQFRSDYAAAGAAGDSAAMEAAHASAEALRGKYGFSGGADGTADIRPEAEGIEGRYDAALRDRTGTLKAAVDADLEDVRRRREEVPLVYREEQNRLAGMKAVQTHALHEQNAAAGLGSGARAQQAIAMSNVYQAASAKLGRELAARLTELEDSRLKLIMDYRAAVAEAISKNESEKAAALYEEYQKKQKENTALAKTQVDAMLKLGVEPSAELIKLTGYSREYIDAVLAASRPTYSGGGGGYSGEGAASGIIGSDAWYADLYRTYGPDAENMIRYHYTQLGLKSGSVKDAVGGYEAWLNAHSSAPAPAPISFGNIKQTIQGYIQQGNAAKATAMAQSYFSGLTSAQKTELSALFTRSGLKL